MAPSTAGPPSLRATSSTIGVGITSLQRQSACNISGNLPSRQGLALGPQGDSVLRVGIGVSAIHALGDGRWRPGMSGSDGARGADLWEVFSVVPDHRRADGKRYPLAGLLMIALAAMLAGRSDQLGIVRWGRKLSREALAELGILRGRVPAPSGWSVERAFPGAGWGRAGTAPRGLGEGRGRSRTWGD